MTPHRVGLGMGSNHEKIYGKRLVTHSLEDLGGGVRYKLGTFLESQSPSHDSWLL